MSKRNEYKKLSSMDGCFNVSPFLSKEMLDSIEKPTGLDSAYIDLQCYGTTGVKIKPDGAIEHIPITDLLKKPDEKRRNS